MKYLEDAALQNLTSQLTEVTLNSTNQKRLLNGKIEAFTIKRGGNDKREANTLKEKLEGSSALYHDATNTAENNKTLIDLILTLNASFPDYDFGNLSFSNFKKYDVCQPVLQTVNAKLGELALDYYSKDPAFLQNLWKSLDKVIHLGECQVYEYLEPIYAMEEEDIVPTDNMGRSRSGSYSVDLNDPTTSGAGEEDGSEQHYTVMWEFHYIFVNYRMKRFALFSCAQYHTCIDEIIMEDDELMLHGLVNVV